MPLEFPTVQINLDYFFQLGQLPVPELLWRLFLDGGWVLAVFIALNSVWLNFTARRAAQYAATVTYTMLSVQVSGASEQTPKAMEHIFSQLASVHSSLTWWEEKVEGKFNPKFSFEFVSVDGTVRFYVRTPSKYRDLVEAAIYSQYSDAEVNETADYTLNVPEVFPDPEWDLTGTEYALKKHWAYPIRTYPEFEHNVAEQKFKDPLVGIFESMNLLKMGEQLWIQILLTPAEDTWHEKAAEVVGKIVGKKVAPKKGLMDTVTEQTMAWPKAIIEQATGVGFGAAPEVKKEEKDKKLTPGESKVLEAVQLKLAKHGFGVKIRVVYVARRGVFNKNRLIGVKGAMNQFGSLDMNAFKTVGAVTPKPGGLFSRGQEGQMKQALYRAYRGRSGSGSSAYYLNTEELATIYHFPALDVKAPLIKKTDAKRSEPPVNLPTADLYETPIIGTGVVEEE